MNNVGFRQTMLSRILHLVLTLSTLPCAFSQPIPQDTWMIVPLTITNGVLTIRDTLGFHDGATYCIDGELDSLFTEVELPPDVPMVFDARFEESRSGSNCLGVGVRLHLQEFGKLDTFRLRITPPSEMPLPLTLTWTAEYSGLTGATLLRLTDLYDGALVSIDMRQDSVLVINTDSLLTLLVHAVGVVDAVEEQLTELPIQMVLDQNYPNPFNGTTRITYTLSHRSYTTLTLYDQIGRRIAILVDGVEPAGTRYVLFDASSLSSGVYYYRLHSEGASISRKFTVAK
jgi:hypothetical protein